MKNYHRRYMVIMQDIRPTITHMKQKKTVNMYNWTKSASWTQATISLAHNQVLT